jgi:hypothetical protein
MKGAFWAKGDENEKVRRLRRPYLSSPHAVSEEGWGRKEVT